MDIEHYFPATTMPDPEWWQALWPDPFGMLKALGFRPGQRVLDLCCGDGYFTAALAQLAMAELYALDIDSEMIKQAKARFATLNLSKCHWITGDARTLQEHIEQPLTHVLIANTFHGVPEPTELSRSVYHALADQGQLIVINWHKRAQKDTPVLGKPRGPKYSLRMTPQKVRDMVEPAGFRWMATDTLLPYHYAIRFEKMV
ncbi:class I SAM-dependent methyltransferase [Magnetococcus sp. PR-3]|uniref:class I SAM-dependent methyltransferase n=1 Tax=Magnetococcus sp. PR-3 TaxID=3120355 RepID=UPI002FCE0FA9